MKMKNFSLYEILTLGILLNSIFTIVLSCDISEIFDSDNHLVYLEFDCGGRGESDSDYITDIIVENPYVERLSVNLAGVNQKLINSIATLKDLKELKFYDNKYYKDLDFEPLKELKNFNILIMEYDGKNSIKNIDKLTSLKEITIHGTYNQQNLDDVLKLPNIEFFDTFAIDENIKKLKWDSLKNLKLKRFDANKKNKFLLRTIKGLKTLTELTFSYWPITLDKEIMDIVTSFSNLENLIIEEAKIESLSGLEKLEHLKILTFKCDDDNDFLSEISKIPNLNELTLENCKFNSVKNNSIENLKKLSLISCDLDQNGIDFITSLTNLEELYLDYVYVSDELDLSSFKNLKKLNTFIYEHSKDDGLLNVFDKLTNIQNLKFVAKSFRSSEIKKISKLTNLKQLYIGQDNYKNTIDVSPLESLQKLTNITISNFELKEIPNFIVLLPNLKYLDLADNKISKIPDSILDLKNLEHLDLGYNEIRNIPQILNQLPKLKYIDLGGEKDLKGQILTNESLEYCNYSGKYGSHGDICKTKDMKCVSNVVIDETLFNIHKYPQIIGDCEDHDNITKSKTTITTTTTKTKITTPSTKISTTTTTTTTKTTKKYYPTTTNGKCGTRDGQCPSGECCSKYGYCGRSDKHCLPSNGCQSEFGKCHTSNNGDLKISTNGKCGAKDGKCPTGECCSKYGYCGRSDKHCLPSNGCQSEFGQCHTSNDGGDLKISTNGKCGAKDGKCPSGECCSKYGYCGHSDKHCDKGCQSEFGQCGSSSTSTITKKTTTKKITTKKTTTKKTTTTKKYYPTTTNGKCGVKDGQCPSGECCSKYGYCGHSDKHCLSSNGCQSEFGQCH